MGCGERDDDAESAAGAAQPTDEATDADGGLEDPELPEPDEEDSADPLEDEPLEDPAEDNTDYEDPAAPEGDIQGG